MADRCASHRGFQALDAAYRAGDLAALRAALGDPPDFPNCRQAQPAVTDHPLEYAIYWSPLAFIAELLALGADPNDEDTAGFPALHAALSTERPDRHDILRLLLRHGADPGQRGINDGTPLHHAVWRRDPEAVAILLAHGADPGAWTRIDDLSTPLEDAVRSGFAAGAALLRESAGTQAAAGTTTRSG